MVDASVAIKWFAPDDGREQHTEEAVALLRAVQRGEVAVVQPVHWICEVLAVLARRNPSQVSVTLPYLEALDFQVVDSLEVYQRAVRLSVKLEHHLFDTLYHAVALETGAELVTADEKYGRKAVGEGAIRILG